MRSAEARPTQTVRRRGRPPEHDRVRALLAIERAFRIRGFGGASLDHLAAAAGMARPSLYAAFGDKRSMYLLALEAARDRLLTMTNDAPCGDDLQAALQCLFARGIAAFAGAPHDGAGCVLLCTASAEAPHSEAVRDVLSGALRDLDAAISSRLAVIAPDLPPAERAGVAGICSAVLHTLALRARAGEPIGRLEDLAASALAMLRRLRRAS